MYYRNIRTKGIYRRLATGIDTTIGRDRASITVVIYCPNNNDHTIYVREAKDFDEKFEFIDFELKGDDA